MGAKEYLVGETAWCPGCANFPIRKALASALVYNHYCNSCSHNYFLISQSKQSLKQSLRENNTYYP